MHAHSLMAAPGGAGPTVTAARTTTISTPAVNPLRGRFGWISLDTWVVRDDQAGGDVAYALLTAAAHPGDPAEQAMPALAEVSGLDSRPGAHTDLPAAMYVTLSEESEQRWATLHIGAELTLRRPVLPPWHQTANTRGWVRVVIGYRAKVADADCVKYLDAALTGHGVTADVRVRVWLIGAAR